jgi:hypothetical protein
MSSRCAKGGGWGAEGLFAGELAGQMGRRG